VAKLGWSDIRNRALKFSKDWENESSETAEAKIRLIRDGGAEKESGGLRAGGVGCAAAASGSRGDVGGFV